MTNAAGKRLDLLRLVTLAALREQRAKIARKRGAR